MIKTELITPLLQEDALASTEMQFPSGIIDENCVTSTEMFQIRYEKFNREVVKTQQRVAGMSMQRIKKEEAEVILEISMKTIAQVADIKVYVKRMVEIEHPPLGFVELKTVRYQTAYDKYLLHIDLDSVYMVDEKVVYCLAKNNTDEKNKFFLKLEVIFIDWSSSVQYSKSFKVIGKLKEQKPKTNADICSLGTWENDSYYQSSIVSGSIDISNQYVPYVAAADSGNLEREMVKRKRSRTDDSISSMDSFDRVLHNLIEEKEGHLEPTKSGKLIQASRIVADHIKAKSADIEELYAVNQIKTPRGDIAYHFVLKDPENFASFQEGELVGIFNNDKRERVLDKLSQKNSHEAIIRGVITRSYFLEAQAQPTEVRTETICMFGIVPVRVKGSIHRGDVLHSSETHPGAAVSVSAFTQAQVKEYATIGFALETMECNDDEFNLIQCLVSVTMEVFGGMMQKKIKQVEGVMGSQVEKIRKSRKKSKKMLYTCFVGTTILASLLGILLWQILMPCTAYRYWRCRQGRIKDQVATFKYVSLSTPTDYTHVSGVEFEFYKLKDKTRDVEGVLPINGTGFRYYLNVDRCACGFSAGGPSIFATDVSCSHVFYYHDVCSTWCFYKSAEMIRCTQCYSKSGITPVLSIKYCTVPKQPIFICLGRNAYLASE